MITPLSVQDISQISNLSVNNMMTPSCSGKTPHHNNPGGRCEMSMPSITFSHANKNNTISMGPKQAITPCAMEAPVVSPPNSGQMLDYPGWIIPMIYLHCGLISCLCNLIAPYWTLQCGRFLCPFWSVGILMHASTHSGVYLWWGLAIMSLYPYVIEMSDGLFGILYILLFAGFASGRFWRDQRGVALILVCACWIGILGALVWTVLLDPTRNMAPPLTLAGFFAIISSLLCTRRASKAVFRVSDCG